MAFKRDEVHGRRHSVKFKLFVTIACILAILVLLYLAVYSFTNLQPLITLLIILVTIIFFGVSMFAIDMAFGPDVE